MGSYDDRTSMGTRIQFTCEHCGYATQVSGGKDYGMVAVVETMTCRDCRELVDVLIGRQGEVGPTGEPDFDRDLGLCPACLGKNVAAWGASRPCPKCDGRMARGEIIAMWD